MNKTTEILTFIKEKFPGQRARIEKLYEEDEDFRSLCADYFLAVNALKRFRASLDDSRHTIEGYENVIESLEKEFNMYVSP